MKVWLSKAGTDFLKTAYVDAFQTIKFGQKSWLTVTILYLLTFSISTIKLMQVKVMEGLIFPKGTVFIERYTDVLTTGNPWFSDVLTTGGWSTLLRRAVCLKSVISTVNGFVDYSGFEKVIES